MWSVTLQNLQGCCVLPKTTKNHRKGKIEFRDEAVDIVATRSPINVNVYVTNC
jgi:hypothetical protein